jgi:hypothetical protein
MRAVDILSLSVAALIGLFTLVLQPWSTEWWASVGVAALIAVAAAIHIVWNYLPAGVKARLGPAAWTADGKVRGGKTRAALGVILLCMIAGTYSALHWQIINFPYQAGPSLPTSPSPLQQLSPLAPLPLLPIQSRFDRFIFACDVPPPQTPEEDAKQKETLKDNIQAWADTIGVNASFFDIKNGTKLKPDLFQWVSCRELRR